MTTIAQQREAWRERKARHRAKPGVREAGREYMRLRRESPEFRAAEASRALGERRSPESWAKAVLRGIKFRAKARGLEFSLTPEDLKLPDVCPVLGRKLVIGYVGNALHNPDSPTVDRLDSSKGYTPDNVRVISMRANLLKKDATVAEMEAVVAYMLREGAP